MIGSQQTLTSIRVLILSHSLPATLVSHVRCLELMDPAVQLQESRGSVISSLNVAIETLNLAKGVSRITPVRAVFGSGSVLLTTIQVVSFYFVGINRL